MIGLVANELAVVQVEQSPGHAHDRADFGLHVFWQRFQCHCARL